MLHFNLECLLCLESQSFNAVTNIDQQPYVNNAINLKNLPVVLIVMRNYTGCMCHEAELCSLCVWVHNYNWSAQFHISIDYKDPEEIF